MPDLKHVILLNDQASVTGGAGAVALLEARALARCGLGVTLLAGVGPPAPELAAETRLQVVCLGQHEIFQNPRRFQAFGQGLRNGRAVRALNRALGDKSRAETIVHVHSWTKALSPFAVAAAARLGFPVIVTLHDYFLACPNGGFFVYPTGEICRRRPLSGACWTCRCDRRNYGHKLWRGVRTWIQNVPLRLPRRVSAYVAVSEYSLRLLQPYLPPTTPARVIRHPVDAPDAGPSPVAQNRDFVYVGRLEAEKGVRLFAAAAAEAGVPAAFVGDGALRAELAALCPAARFTGWLDPAKVRSELRRARALVFPPLWHETLGLVVVEAAAAGVPAIVSDRCAITDHVRDGVNGVHFTRGSHRSLTSRLRELAVHGERAGALGQAAYRWYWDDPWTTERHVAELLELYARARGVGARN